jgi:hypothetical protein
MIAIPSSDNATHALDKPQPNKSHGNVNAAIGRIDTARRTGMQRQEPREDSKRQRTRYQQCGALSLLEPQVRQIAADYLGNRGSDIQA